VECQTKEIGGPHRQCASPSFPDESNLFEHHSLKKLPWPLYLPDISPLDFCVFGKRKSVLIWHEIPDEIDLLEIMTQLLDGIWDDELQAVFRSSIECVQNVIDANRDNIS
jgi:hypothetical protein